MACYSDIQLAAALRNAGVSAGDAAVLVATSHPESGGCSVVQQGQPYATTGWGVWQITPGNSEPQFGINNALLGLQANANAAAAKLRAQGLNAWTTFTSGKYLPFLSAAKSAVTSVYNMSSAEVNTLVNSAGSGSSQSAQTTGVFNPLAGIGSDIFGNLLSDIAKGLGIPSPKDLFIRLGLILLGAALVIVALAMMVGKQAATTAVTVVAPETRAVGAAGAVAKRGAT